MLTRERGYDDDVFVPWISFFQLRNKSGKQENASARIDGGNFVPWPIRSVRRVRQRGEPIAEIGCRHPKAFDLEGRVSARRRKGLSRRYLEHYCTG